MLSILCRQFGGEFGLDCLRPKADPEGNLSSIVFVSGRTGENLMPSPPPTFASAGLSLEPAAAHSPCRAPLDPGRYPAATARFQRPETDFCLRGRVPSLPLLSSQPRAVVAIKRLRGDRELLGIHQLPHLISLSFARPVCRRPTVHRCRASVHRGAEALLPCNASATFDCGDPHG